MENTMTAADIQAQATKIEDNAKTAIPENKTREEFIKRVSKIDPLVQEFFCKGFSAKNNRDFEAELKMFNGDRNDGLGASYSFNHHLPLSPVKPPRFYTPLEAATLHVSDDLTRKQLSSIKVENGYACGTDGRRLVIVPFTDFPDGMWREIDKKNYIAFGDRSEDDVKKWIDAAFIDSPPNIVEAIAMSEAYKRTAEFTSHYPRKIGKKWYHNNIEGEYPNVKQVIPTDLSDCFVIEHAEKLLPHVQAALNFYKLRGTDSTTVTVLLNDEMVYFDGVFIRDALLSLGGFGPVTFYIGDVRGPAVLKAGDALAVIMPMRGERADDYSTVSSGVIINMPGWDKVSNAPSPTKRKTITKTTKRTIYAVASMITESTLLVVTQDGAVGFAIPSDGTTHTEDDAIEIFKNECHRYLTILGLADSIDLRITKGR